MSSNAAGITPGTPTAPRQASAGPGQGVEAGADAGVGAYAGVGADAGSCAGGWAVPGVEFVPEVTGSADPAHLIGITDTRPNAAGTSVAKLDLPAIDPEAPGLAVVLRPGPLAALSDDTIVQLAREAEVQGREIDALRVQLAGEIEARASVDYGEGSLAHRYDCRNAVELLQRVTQITGRSAARRCALAREVRPTPGLTGQPIPPKFPAVAAALSEHAIGIEAAEYITRSLSGLPAKIDSAAISVAEQSLVAAACGTVPPGGGEAALPLHADDVRAIAKVYVATLDQDGPEPSFEEQYLKRGFRFGAEANGLIPVHGSVVPEVAALFGRMIDAITSPRTKRIDAEGLGGPDMLTGSDGLADSAGSASSNAIADATAADGIAITDHSGTKSRVRFVEVGPDDIDSFAPRDERTSDQKRHDALAVIAQAAAQQSGMPTLGGAPVTVMIQVTETELATGRGTAWLHGHDGEPTPIPVSDAAHAGCAGYTQRLVQNEDGAIIELGTKDRIFNAHQRRAIAVRDGGCIIPGCTVPATWCEIHHVTEYANGGPTHTDNGVALCWYHHRSLDTNGWHIRMINGLPEVLAPPWIDPATKWRPARSPLKPPGPTASRRKAHLRT